MSLNQTLIKTILNEITKSTKDNNNKNECSELMMPKNRSLTEAKERTLTGNLFHVFGGKIELNFVSLFCILGSEYFIL